MGVSPGAGEGTYSYGKGTLQILRHDPKEYVLFAGGDARLLEAVESAYGPLELKNHFVLDRGPYKLAAVLDEGVSDDPLLLTGSFIDLYDPNLPVYNEVTVRPGSQDLLYDLTKSPKAPCILAAASRAYNIRTSRRHFSYLCKSPLETVNVSRILLPARPVQVLLDGKVADFEWDDASKTCLLRHDNHPDGVTVDICW